MPVFARARNEINIRGNEMKEKLPKRYQLFLDKYPDIAEAYQNLGEAIHQRGPLDDKTRALIKMAISGSTKQESAFKSHIYKAKALGITKAEMEHVAFLTLPTLGFSTSMMLLSIIDEEFKNE